MNISHINSLLSPLEAALRLHSLEDAQDIASEIVRLCRLELLKAQAVSGVVPLLDPAEHVLATLRAISASQGGVL